MSRYTGSKGRADHVDQLVSRRLRTRRIVLGLSQEDLSEAVDVSVQQVQKYEKAINRISSGKLYNFSKILNVPVNYFFDKNEEDYAVTQSNVAEESAEYHSKPKPNEVINTEIVSLVKAFCAVQSPNIRKQLLEFVKLMSLIPKA